MLCCFGSMFKRHDNRIDIIDALRGVSILLMVVYHFGYDMVMYGRWPDWILFNPAINTLQSVFAGVFILLCGFSCRYSRNNPRRGILLLTLAAIISVATYLADTPIYFGILHFLGVSVLIYSAAPKFFSRVPPYIWIILLILSAAVLNLINSSLSVDIPRLWILGIPDSGFYTADYFPIFPWIFVFLFGTWFGGFTKEKRMPEWFYKTKVPVISAVGRHTLLIYLLHQPVLYLVLYLTGCVK